MTSAGLLSALHTHARRTPSAAALVDGRGSLSWARLPALVRARSIALRTRGVRSLALLAPNGIGWVLADLAAADADALLVPLPSFFSDEQIAHALDGVRPDAVLGDDPARVAAVARVEGPPEAFADGLVLQRLAHPVAPPPGVSKITFTSGSTGRPKGVLLTDAGQFAVADALRVASRMDADDRHLCTLPLAVLLEDVAGVQRTLLAGGCVLLPPLSDLGVAGSSSIDGRLLAHALASRGATSTILTPEVLAALLDALAAGAPCPRALRFAGVGGATVAPALLHAAATHGLPVYEGYGLSEATSVVSLNAPDANRRGSVGRPLPHVRVRIDEHGEICVRGPGVSPGYVGEPARAAGAWLPTGDLGAFDDDGYLHLRGRRNNLVVTSYGRNISPEWLERLLLDSALVHQAVVFGDGRPGPVAVLVTDADDRAIERMLAALDVRLPDYARLVGWVRANAPFSVANGQWLPTGRPRRTSILAAYGQALSTCSRAAVPPHPISGRPS